MKKIYTSIALSLLMTSMFAQPILVRDSLHTGLRFNLYALSNVNTADLMPSGANVSWDLSSTTATLAGTVDFLEMSDTPYELDYPAANFAIKFTTGASSSYNLFNLTNSIFEEVVNIGIDETVPFLNYRTALVFPFTYGLSNSDTYQKVNQDEKTTTDTYDGYGTFITNTTTYNDVVRIYTEDNGNVAVMWWRTNPMIPLFRASSDGFELWELTSTPIGITEKDDNRIFEIYPNPANNTLNIISIEKISMVEIYNITGQLQFSSNESHLDISRLKTGVYFVKAYSEKGVVSKKFVKE